MPYVSIVLDDKQDRESFRLFFFRFGMGLLDKGRVFGLDHSLILVESFRIGLIDVQHERERRALAFLTLAAEIGMMQLGHII